MRGCAVSAVTRLMGRSRQSYYKQRKRSAQQELLNKKLMDFVRPIRNIMPRVGGRKLHYMISNELTEARVKIGRDKFFDWLRNHDLLVRPKRNFVRTTHSNHRFWIYDNLAQHVKVEKPNQLWVSDITYIRTMEGFCYLALITDAYSRKIVGYNVSDTLELEGCLRALKTAFQTASDLSQLVHHSDRGIQYCSNHYVRLLKSKGIQISMAAKGNCYENALAERINGILKDEFNLDSTFRTKQQAIQTVHESIYIYNRHRPHWSLNLKTPQCCHAA